MNTQEINIKANNIAGAIWEDREQEGTLAEQLEAAANWRNLGTDGDLTAEDRSALRALAREARRAE
jgi:hypothetical protein